MIDLKLIHELYIKNINTRLKSILIENVQYIESHSQLKNLLLEYEGTIKKYSTSTLQEIYKSVNSTLITSLRFPSYPIYTDGKQLNFKAIKLYIEKYVWYNKIIISNNKKIQQYKDELISFSLYNRIVKAFNSQVIDKIIDNNYLFTPLLSFGAIGVIQNYNEHRRPNWGKSNKNKAEIIAKGGIPYIKVDDEKDENYKGEKWLVYHPFLDFYLQWHTKWITKKHNPFLKDYVYYPARGKQSIVSKLQVVKQDRDKAKLLYNRTLDT